MGEILDMAQKGDNNEAIRATLKVLEKDPNEPMTTETLNFLLSRAITNERISTFDRSLLSDPRVQSRMKVCSECHSAWAPTPASQMGYAKAMVSNPVGGKCPKCGNIFCRKCAPGMYCPNCKTGFWGRQRVQLDCVHY